MTEPQIHHLMKSGHVIRWHQNPEMNRCRETLAEHQWAVAALVFYLKPDASANLIKAALFHDVGELHAGDVSGLAKAEPGFPEEAHAAFESECRRTILGDMAPQKLSEDEAVLLHLCDKIAAAIFVSIANPHEANQDHWQDKWTDLDFHIRREFRGSPVVDRWREIWCRFSP